MLSCEEEPKVYLPGLQLSGGLCLPPGPLVRFREIRCVRLRFGTRDPRGEGGEVCLGERGWGGDWRWTRGRRKGLEGHETVTRKGRRRKAVSRRLVSSLPVAVRGQARGPLFHAHTGHTWSAAADERAGIGVRGRRYCRLNQQPGSGTSCPMGPVRGFPFLGVCLPL